MRCGRLHRVILPRRPCGSRHTLPPDAQSCYSRGADRPGSSSLGIHCPTKKKTADLGHPEIAEKFLEVPPSAWCLGLRGYGPGTVGLSRARQITMPVTMPIAGKKIQRKRLRPV